MLKVEWDGLLLMLGTHLLFFLFIFEYSIPKNGINLFFYCPDPFPKYMHVPDSSAIIYHSITHCLCSEFLLRLSDCHFLHPFPNISSRKYDSFTFILPFRVFASILRVSDNFIVSLWCFLTPSLIDLLLCSRFLVDFVIYLDSLCWFIHIY